MCIPFLNRPFSTATGHQYITLCVLTKEQISLYFYIRSTMKGHIH